MVHKLTLKNKGFTLVELLIAVSVLLILMTVTIALINPTKVRNNANTTKSLSELGVITNALEFYYSDFSEYPSALSGLSPNYITDSEILKDANNVNYCYLRTMSGSKVVGYKICTLSSKDTAPLFSAEKGSYDVNECSYVDGNKVECLQSPF